MIDHELAAANKAESVPATSRIILALAGDLLAARHQIEQLELVREAQAESLRKGQQGRCRMSDHQLNPRESR